MRSNKPRLTPQQQFHGVVKNGLQVQHRNRALRLPEVTCYFRLITYMPPLQHMTTEGRRFQDGGGLDQIYSLYQLDSSLRQLAMAELATEAQIDINLQRVDRPRQSVLSRAFSDQISRETVKPMLAAGSDS